MIKNIIILTLSEEIKKKCVIAYDPESKKLIRLISNSIDGEGIDNSHLDNINLLDEVSVNIIGSFPLGHQSENVLLDFTHGIKKTNRTGKYKFLEILKSDNQLIFGNCDHIIKDISSLRHSIEILEFNSMYFTLISTPNSDLKITKANFSIGLYAHTNYTVTDTNYLEYTKNIQSGYIVISISPNTDFFEKKGYSKFVSAIYPK